MNRAVLQIVEGHGEVEAVPLLLRRIAGEALGRWDLEVLRPIRRPRSSLIARDGRPARGLEHALRLAGLKLAQRGGEGFTLLLLDADDGCPARLSSSLRSVAGSDVSVVFAKVEFETWFAASAATLTDLLDVPTAPNDPESDGLGKGWVRRHFRRGRYSESVDQVRLVDRLGLALTRGRSPSFDKLCREIGRRLGEFPPAT